MSVTELGETAVVLGTSIGGLLAARVLSDFYDNVKLVDRDVLPQQPITRRGVPQGGLPHIPAARGVQIMNDLFPGFSDELLADGARVWNDGDLSRICASFSGHLFVRTGHIPNPESVVMLFAHRPFLEWSLRRKVQALPNVQILPGRDVVKLTSTPQHERFSSVVLAERGSGVETSVTADLVVDAMGLGSRTPIFLEGGGYHRPSEDTLMVHVTYAGLPVRVPAGTLRELLAFSAPEPGRPRGYAMFAGQNDTYMLAVQTVAGHEAPTDRASLLKCLAGLAPPHVLDAVHSAEPLGDVTRYRFPSNRWRRYDKLARTPDNLIVIGDALCNFNPLYGQGMSVAAIEALELLACLQQGDRNLAHRYFRRSAKQIRRAWQSAVNSDLSLPQIAGKRPLSTRFANAYLDRVLTAAESDPAVVQQFMRTLNMMDAPSRLLRPPMVHRVFRARRKRRGDAGDGEPPNGSRSAGKQAKDGAE